MKTTLCTLSFAVTLLLTHPAPSLSYTYNRLPAYTGDTQQQLQSSLLSGTAPPLPPLYTLPPTASEAQTEVTWAADDAVDDATEQQQETVDKYLDGLLNKLGTYGAPEVVQEAAEEAVDNIQETMETAQENLQEAVENVQENVQEIVDAASVNLQQTRLENTTVTPAEVVENIKEKIEDTVETIQEQAENIQEKIEEATETIQEKTEETAEAIQETLEAINETAQEIAEEVQDNLEELTTNERGEVIEDIVEHAEEQVENLQENLEEVQEIVEETLESQTNGTEQAEEEQLEQAEEILEQIQEHPQETYQNLIDAIKGKTTNDTDDEDDDNHNDGAVVSTPSPTDVNDSQDDDVVTTVAPAMTTDDDDDSNEITTAAPEQTNDENDDSADDDVTTTIIPTFHRTLLPLDESDEDNSDETTTVAPVDDDSEEKYDDVSTTTSVPNLCTGCEFKHGVGYNPHPSDCTLFVQCRLDRLGTPVVAGVKSCPHGLYWNQNKLTCDYRRNVKCVDDICSGVKKTKRSDASCRGYWDCSTGIAVAKCCAKGFAYNPVTNRCDYQPACRDDCLATSTQVSFECSNGMRGVEGDSTVYEVKTGNTWTRMPCPPTLAFSTNPCGCNIPRSQATRNIEPVCAPELYLPFHSDARDFSGRNVYVKNEGVTVKGGKAFFDGNSRLTINRFSHAWWGKTVYVHLRFKSFPGNSGKRQALVSNGDCQVRPSLAVCAGPRGVDFYAETQDSSLPANITVPYGYQQTDGWQDVLYRVDDGQLHGYVNSQTSQTQAKGNLESRQRGLVIGSGGGCEDFEGFIDEVTVYLCKPYFK